MLQIDDVTNEILPIWAKQITVTDWTLLSFIYVTDLQLSRYACMYFTYRSGASSHYYTHNHMAPMMKCCATLRCSAGGGVESTMFTSRIFSQTHLKVHMMRKIKPQLQDSEDQVTRPIEVAEPREHQTNVIAV